MHSDMQPETLNLDDLMAALNSALPASRWLSLLEAKTSRTSESLLTEVGDLSGYPIMGSDALLSLRPAFNLVSYNEMLRLRCVIGQDQDGRLCAAISAPFDSALSVWMARLSIPLAIVALADPRLIQLKLGTHEIDFSAVAEAVAVDEGGARIQNLDVELSLDSIRGEASPAIRLIDSTVFDALRLEASDIHLETVPEGLSIKFRIDGVLNHIATLSNPSLAEQAVARVKVLAELDIAEKRVPQDGRFRVVAKGREIDVRTSIMPTIHGEDAVLRILDKKTLIAQAQGLTLDALGFDEPTIRVLRRMASEPYGMLLITGPTGSGKTTTLYALLTEINRGQDKILTIEDPVEYQLPGVAQIPVNEKKGLSFAVGLRSILRHDPDKILVGEIRDPETAQIAVQSALTGHMVFTSVHANNVFDVIARFMHMGVDPYNFVSSLSGVVAQRLLRLNCQHCIEPETISLDLLAESGIEDASDYQFKAGRGCNHCRNTGFRGRRAIAEVLRLNDEIREMIVARAPVRGLKQEAKRNGTRFLREIALELVRTGTTTLQEANRVTFVA